jgi:predicted PurR-regulated permease PerM
LPRDDNGLADISPRRGDFVSRIATGSLVMLAFVAGIALLYFGAPFFIPFFLAVLIAYALSPLVDLLTRVVRWRVLSATLVMGVLLALIGVAGWTWSDDAALLWQRVPEAARSISTSLKKASQKPASPVAQVKEAAAEIEKIAQAGTPKGAAVVAAPPPTPVWTMVWNGGRSAVEALASVVAVLFLVFFMLASGDLFKRKLVRMFGETLSEKKITVQMIDEIDGQIRRYLVVLLVANLLVGFGTWITFRIMGVNYAELWGLAAGIIHTAPYFGPAIIAVGSLVAGFLQFGNWGHAFLVAGVSILVATLVGSVFATWLSARQTQMNTTATFVGLLFFGWIWNLWGILLAIPLLAIVKAVCERHEAWQPIAELLRREEDTKRLPPEAEKTSASPPRDAPSMP